MLRIQSETGQLLQLEPDISVELELNSWLLADSDDLPGSFSYPINFPLSDQNKRFLGHSHLPESRPREQNVSVWVNGVMLKQASLAYKIEKSGASGYLKIDAGEVATRVRGKQLHEALAEKYYYGSSYSNLTLLMKAAATAAPGDYPFTFFPVSNSVFAPEPKDFTAIPGYRQEKMINPWNGNNFVVSKERHIVPFLYLTYVIEKACEFFGYKATGSFLQHPEVKCMTVYNTQTLSLALSDVQPGIRQSLGLHVPFMSISDFLRALRDDFGVGIFFDAGKRECSFELYETIRDNETFHDFSPYLLKGYDNENPDEKGYAVTSYQDGEDGFFKEYQPVVANIREAQKQVKAKIGTLQMRSLPNFENAVQNWLIPVALQKGNLAQGFFREAADYYNLVPDHKNGFGLRLLSYRGMQPDEQGDLYPYGTSTTRRYDQGRVGAWSLDAKQSDSVFNKLTVPFYTFLAYARRLRYNLLLPIAHAKNIRLQDVYGFRGENSVLVKALVSSVNVSLPGKSGNVLAKASVMLLLSPEATPSVYSDEQFYVEMFITNEYQNVDGDRTISYVDFKFRVWADAGKTVPANPTNLVIRYEEYVSRSAPGESDTNTTNFYEFTMSGHEYNLTGLITSDQNPNEQLTIVYGMTSSADYVIL
ncbi:hypothetical protein ACWKW6_12695 [Dyadobacter jiangsuensis]